MANPIELLDVEQPASNPRLVGENDQSELERAKTTQAVRCLLQQFD